MTRRKLKWFLPVVLAGIFAAARPALAQGRYESEVRRNRIDRRQDRRALRRDGRRIVRRQQKLRADVRHYGPNSTRARIDRRQLRHARHQFRHQARDLRQDRGDALRR